MHVVLPHEASMRIVGMHWLRSVVACYAVSWRREPCRVGGVTHGEQPHCVTLEFGPP